MYMQKCLNFYFPIQLKILTTEIAKTIYKKVTARLKNVSQLIITVSRSSPDKHVRCLIHIHIHSYVCFSRMTSRVFFQKVDTYALSIRLT
jgi:hypothetical protein